MISETESKPSLRSVVRQIKSEVEQEFVGREQEALVATLALITKNHAVFIGEPGTAKTALLRNLTERMDGTFYTFLMSKYSTPDELIGPINPVEYKNGKFVRSKDHWLPDADIAFIDEVFKGSSQTLNTLLNIMNERRFVDSDGTERKVPLRSMFAASNELPQGEELAPFYDRFLLKVFVDPVSEGSLKEGIRKNISKLGVRGNPTHITKEQLDEVYDEITQVMRDNADQLANLISTIVTSMRNKQIFVSDRTAMGSDYLPRLVAAYNWLTGMTMKKSLAEVARFIIQDNDEQLDALNKVMEALYPAEITEIENKIMKLDDLIKNGNLGDAEKTAMESLNILQALLKKDDMADLYTDEITDATNRIQQRLNRIQEAKKLIQG